MKRILSLILLVLLPLARQARNEVVFGWGDSGRHYPAAEKPAFDKVAFPFAAWRGERVNALALLWSPEALSGVTVESGALRCGKAVLPASALKASLVSYVTGDVLAEGYNQCGKRDTVSWKPVREADLIGRYDCLDVPAATVQPVWLSVDVPSDAVPGRYKGTLTLRSGALALTLPYTLTVGTRALTPPAERPFHLDLWQNPYTFARVAGVRLWSPEHFAAMRPVMEHLARAGQKVITATLMNRPWNGQTEDAFGSMVTKIRRVDGSWLYDYTVFDKWVEFMMSVGIDRQINCYTLIPWKLEFEYFDQATGAVTTVLAPTDSPEYEDYWGSFILDFSRHLREKGWFGKTMIAMDERGEEAMRNALSVIHKYEPEMKVALAGNYHASVADEIDDLCLPFRSEWPEGVIERLSPTPSSPPSPPKPAGWPSSPCRKGRTATCAGPSTAGPWIRSTTPVSAAGPPATPIWSIRKAAPPCVSRRWSKACRAMRKPASCWRNGPPQPLLAPIPRLPAVWRP